MIGKFLYVVICLMTILFAVGIGFGSLAIEIAHKIQEWMNER